MDQTLTTNAPRVGFLVMDPSGQYETGNPVTWSDKLVLHNRLFEEKGARTVELFVAPKGTIRYTLDGSEPREGTLYDALGRSGGAALRVGRPDKAVGEARLQAGGAWELQGARSRGAGAQVVLNCLSVKGAIRHFFWWCNGIEANKCRAHLRIVLFFNTKK